jgi:hypothetical protein
MTAATSEWIGFMLTTTRGASAAIAAVLNAIAQTIALHTSERLVIQPLLWHTKHREGALLATLM